MKLIHAIYEGGVFRPTEPVDLPDHCRVRLGAIAVDDEPTAKPPPNLASFVGLLKALPVDPLEYQRRSRAEWDRSGD